MKGGRLNGCLKKNLDGGLRCEISRHDRLAYYSYCFGRESGWGKWKDYLATREYIVAHESAHYLRRLSKPINAEVSRWAEYSNDLIHSGVFLEEAIAEMCAIKFMRGLGRFDRASSFASQYKFFAPAYQILEDKGPEIIGELNGLDVNKAIDVILPYEILISEKLLVPR